MATISPQNHEEMSKPNADLGTLNEANEFTEPLLKMNDAMENCQQFDNLEKGTSTTEIFSIECSIIIKPQKSKFYMYALVFGFLSVAFTNLNLICYLCWMHFTYYEVDYFDMRTKSGLRNICADFLKQLHPLSLVQYIIFFNWLVHKLRLS